MDFARGESRGRTQGISPCRASFRAGPARSAKKRASTSSSSWAPWRRRAPPHWRAMKAKEMEEVMMEEAKRGLVWRVALSPVGHGGDLRNPAAPPRVQRQFVEHAGRVDSQSHRCGRARSARPHPRRASWARAFAPLTRPASPVRRSRAAGGARTLRQRAHQRQVRRSLRPLFRRPEPGLRRGERPSIRSWTDVLPPPRNC